MIGEAIQSNTLKALVSQHAIQRPPWVALLAIMRSRRYPYASMVRLRA